MCFKKWIQEIFQSTISLKTDMLSRLSISNYELIDHIDLTFHEGLNVITGETGTGKSMILSAIHLLTGGRGSDKVLKDSNKKCVLEASFTTSASLKDKVESEGLDFLSELLIRREYTPQGRSRAFVNDTPVNLDVLKKISKHILDIHSQDQTNNINNPEYQLELLDIYCLNTELLEDYQSCFRNYDDLKTEIKRRKSKTQKDKEEKDFIHYQWSEMDDANLEEGEIHLLEEEKEILSKQEDIKHALEAGSFTISEKDQNLSDLLYEVKQRFSPINEVSSWLKEIDRRLNEIHSEIKDLGLEMDSRKEGLEMNPHRLAELEDRLNLYYSLENKFKVNGDVELIELRNSYKERLNSMLVGDEDILSLEKELETIYIELIKKGEKLSKSRVKNASQFSKEIEFRLKQLGISHPKIIFKLATLDQASIDGLDSVKVLFSSNKDQEARWIEEVASGGEKSRVMLAIKSIIGNKREINSMIFDEIDTGISGEVAIKTGDLLSDIGKNNQVISITHLPQVASKGIHHYKVSKSIVSNRTNVNMHLLKTNERVEELAEMLGGKNISISARKTAEELLR